MRPGRQCQRANASEGAPMELPNQRLCMLGVKTRACSNRKSTFCIQYLRSPELNFDRQYGYQKRYMRMFGSHLRIPIRVTLRSLDFGSRPHMNAEHDRDQDKAPFSCPHSPNELRLISALTLVGQVVPWLLRLFNNNMLLVAPRKCGND